VHGKLRHAIPYLLKPVNYWRTAEYRAVMCEAGFAKGDRILDVASPKLLSLYLAEQMGATVTTTDIDHYFVEKLQEVRKLRRIPEERLRIQVEDGRQLSFADQSFDKVYSISVLEHIPERGDIECIREIRRVLVDGGRCVLTVPFAKAARDEYRSGGFYWQRFSGAKNGRTTFYQRRYDEAALRERLIDGSGMKLERLSFIGERILTGLKREVADLLPDISGLVQPLLSRMLHTRPTESWRDLAKPLCAVLVLKK
jgi:ubiquinone/menaquinone biosynthesis C-methylase UbiE